MSETVTIPAKTYNHLQRILSRIEAKLEREELGKTITEAEAAAFMEVGVPRFRNMVGDGTIPRTAYRVTHNGSKKFFIDKLVK